jgi:hypothetical protein
MQCGNLQILDGGFSNVYTQTDVDKMFATLRQELIAAGSLPPPEIGEEPADLSNMFDL